MSRVETVELLRQALLPSVIERIEKSKNLSLTGRLPRLAQHFHIHRASPNDAMISVSSGMTQPALKVEDRIDRGGPLIVTRQAVEIGLGRIIGAEFGAQLEIRTHWIIGEGRD